MFASLIVAVAVAQPPKPDDVPVLPPTWRGKWTGTLVITPEKGDPQELPMSLEIGPIGDGSRYTFRITYGKQVRNYELVPKAGKPGRFEVDEKNGIRIDVRLVGSTLVGLFAVGDTMIQSRYERTGDVLKVEMTAFAVKGPLATKLDGGDTEVKSYRVVSVQVAELKLEKIAK